MNDPAELLGIIDVNEKNAETADLAHLEAMRRLGNFIEAVAHDRFGIEADAEDGNGLENAAIVDEAKKSVEINYQNAITSIDEAIETRARSLLARHRVAKARDTLLTEELTSDAAQHDD